jgi:hypothetical protein
MLTRTFTLAALGLLLAFASLSTPAAARTATVGGIVNTVLRNMSNQYPQKISCHDVLRGDGSLGQECHAVK